MRSSALSRLAESLIQSLLSMTASAAPSTSASRKSPPVSRICREMICQLLLASDNPLLSDALAWRADRRQWTSDLSRARPQHLRIGRHKVQRRWRRSSSHRPARAARLRTPGHPISQAARSPRVLSNQIAHTLHATLLERIMERAPNLLQGSPGCGSFDRPPSDRIRRQNTASAASIGPQRSACQALVSNPLCRHSTGLTRPALPRC